MKADLLSVAEAAKLLDVTVQSVYEWIKAERLSAVKIGKKGTALQRSDVERFRDERAKETAK